MYNKGSSLPALTGIVLAVLLFLAGSLINSCSRDNGSAPYSKDAGSVAEFEGLDSSAEWSGGGMRISVNPGTLKATVDDKAAVTVTLYDERHNPIVDKKITFASSHGIIDASATTDAMGMATVNFSSEPWQGDAWIGAAVQISSDSLLRVARKINVSGLDLQLSPEATDVQTGTKVKVVLELLDASGSPLPDQEIVLTGDATGKYTTDGTGKSSITITRDTQDTATINATALGASASTSVRFWTKVPEGTANNVTGIRSMRLFASRTQLRADNSDEAEVTAILVNEKNNPATGDTVYFESNLGVIDTYGIVDSSGRAHAILHSAPVSGQCRVIASARGGTVKDAITVQFTGLTLSLQSPSSGARAGTLVAVEALLQDASNNPIGGDQIVFTVQGGTFENGTTLFTTNLDGNGKATAQVSSTAAGTAIVRAAALNASDTVALLFSRDLLILTADKSWLRVGGVDSTTLNATFTDNSGAALAGKTVRFYTTSGSIAASATTSVLGVASVTLKSANFSGNATIQALTDNASAETSVEMRAATATMLKLTTTPDNIGINGGITELIAEVTDAGGNTVSGETVSFRILQGPGGGESIGKVTVATQAGVAKSSLLAGSRPSSYRGVLVEASTAGGQADTAKLTISGLPYTVTVARPEDDTVKVEEAGLRDQSVFRYYVGAVVQDVNGNPVADGTPVHFSAVVSGMAVYTRYLVEWAGVNGTSDLKAVIGYRRLDIPFEDINNNNAMDKNIDLILDFNDNVARRGDDADGDGGVNYNPSIHDVWYDFNNNGVCDPAVGEPKYDVVNYPNVYADLDRNGYHTPSELVVDHDGDNLCDLALGGDFRYWLWEMLPMWSGIQFNFDQNDFAVVIDVSAVTVGGVAKTAVTYPRQVARRLFVTVNGEANGVKDSNGERFVLPVIVE